MLRNNRVETEAADIRRTDKDFVETEAADIRRTGKDFVETAVVDIRRTGKGFVETEVAGIHRIDKNFAETAAADVCLVGIVFAVSLNRFQNRNLDRNSCRFQFVCRIFCNTFVNLPFIGDSDRNKSESNSVFLFNLYYILYHHYVYLSIFRLLVCVKKAENIIKYNMRWYCE